MNNVWRFTGNPENWITAIGLSKWALNENNRSLWERKIKPGDTIIFHSTRNSGYTKNAESVIIGFGYAGQSMYIKDDYWWVQEVNDSENYWPYVVPLKEIYLFSNVDKINFNIPVHEKSIEQVTKDIEILTSAGLKISSLNKQALAIDSSLPNFPVNGSASGINEIYEHIILDENNEFYLGKDTQETKVLETKLNETIDEKISSMSNDELFALAIKFDNKDEESHTLVFGPRKVRKENQIQKRRIAKLENYTCQVCEFHCEYKKRNGKIGYIIHVDHIQEKSEGGSENIYNLWVLCPNCHAKKTFRVIRVDLENKKVFVNDEEVLIKDRHLFI